MQKAKHGTRSRYNHHRCRCSKCVKANRAYQLARYHATKGVKS